MADTGWLDHASFFNDDYTSGPPWTDLSNAVSENGVYAVNEVPADGDDITDWLRGQDISAAIPVGAAIEGIEVRVKLWREDAGLQGSVSQAILHMDGVEKSVNTAVYGAIPLSNDWSAIYGGPTILWGFDNIDRDDVNDSTFGVAFNIQFETVGGPWDIYVDCVQIKIYYSFLNTGWRSPNLSVNRDVGNTDWSFPNSAKDEDGNTAYLSLLGGAPGESSNFIRLYDYGFSIPLGMDIRGIEVKFKRYGSGNTDIQTESLVLHKGGAGGESEDKATLTNWPSTNTYSVVFGSPTDLWLTEFNNDDVEDSAFGAEVQAFNSHASTTRTARIDTVQIRLWYSRHINYHLPSHRRL